LAQGSSAHSISHLTGVLGTRISSNMATKTMLGQGNAEAVAALQASNDALRQSNAQLTEVAEYLQRVYRQAEGRMNEEMSRLDLVRVIANLLHSQGNNMNSYDCLSILAPCAENVPVTRFARSAQ